MSMKAIRSLMSHSSRCAAIALALLCAIVPAAHAQKTKAALTSEITTNWPDNTSGAITPAILRSTVIDIVNSYYDLAGGTSLACAAHQWVAGLPTLSSLTCTQPAFTDISGTLGATQFPALTGDITTTAGALATTLATVNSNTGAFGSATQCVTVTNNAKGLTTAVSAATCTPAIGSITGLGTGIATALGVNVGTAGAPVVNGAALGTPSSGVGTNLTGTATGLTAGNVTTNANLTGPVTSVGNATTIASQVVTYANMATAAIATAANVIAGTANTLVPAANIYSAETTTTFGATTTFDLSTFINTAVTLTGNITTMTLSNVKAGQAGQIRFIQDGTGSRTTVWNSIFKFTGGVTPTLSTTAGAIDVLFYSCISASICYASLNLNMK